MKSKLKVAAGCIVGAVLDDAPLKAPAFGCDACCYIVGIEGTPGMPGIELFCIMGTCCFLVGFDCFLFLSCSCKR